MKITLPITLLLSFAFLGSACTPKAAPVSTESIEAKALAMIENLNKGDYAAASADFDMTMKQAVPESKMKEIWEALLAQMGAFTEITGTRSAEQGQYQIIFVTCAFENAAIDVQITYNSKGQVAGLFFQPVEAENSTPIPYNLPSYAQQNAFQEEDVTVGSGEWALPGTLTIPNGAGPFPAVVLVHGSGPNDRDETIGPNKIFKDLAWGLASRGIAVLRYDKRTFVHAAKYDENLAAEITTKEEVTDDALEALRFLRSRDEIDPQRVYLLGHSLGATLAPRIGALDEEIAGLILMAGITRPLEDVTLDQITYLSGLDGEINADEQANIDILKTQVARVKGEDLSDQSPAKDLPLGISPAYWLDLRSYSPAETAVNLDLPMLILQGERDYQVTMLDFEGWKEALGGRGDVILKSYPALNHLFIAGTGQPNPQEYSIEGHVDGEVIIDLANFILR